mgnify:CR=1 FL=1
MSDQPSGRARLGKQVESVWPLVGWDMWSARRSLKQFGATDLLPWSRSAASPPELSPRRLLYIVPSRDAGYRWGAGLGNHSFDLAVSAGETFEQLEIHTLEVGQDEAPDHWHQRVVDDVLSLGITHVAAHVEHGANDADDWSWDILVKRLRRRWRGVFIAVSYDSAYPSVVMHLDRLSRLYPGLSVMAIDRPIPEGLRPHRTVAGPAFLPVPSVSIAALDAELEGLEPSFDVTFIGNVEGYPYRSELLGELASAGIAVTVNPHQSAGATRPGFAAYAAALRMSRITLNFSRCNGMPVTQLKTRILEGSLFGTVVASDSSAYTHPYFTPGEHFLAYSSPQELKGQLEGLLADQEALARMRTAARARAVEIAPRAFWIAVEGELRRRGLLRLTVTHS